MKKNIMTGVLVLIMAAFGILQNAGAYQIQADAKTKKVQACTLSEAWKSG